MLSDWLLRMLSPRAAKAATATAIGLCACSAEELPKLLTLLASTKGTGKGVLLSTYELGKVDLSKPTRFFCQLLFVTEIHEALLQGAKPICELALPPRPRGRNCGHIHLYVEGPGARLSFIVTLLSIAPRYDQRPSGGPPSLSPHKSIMAAP